MPGIQIGDGAIIATKSVVTKMLKHTVVGGNPAQEIRKRFEESIIELVLIQWWNWDIEKITRNLKAICSTT